MNYFFLVLGYCSAAIGTAYFIASLFHLADDHKNDFFTVMVLGAFATKVMFSEKGWRYRVLGVRYIIAAMVLAFLWVTTAK